MSRLTERDRQGHWRLKKLNWDNIRPGERITKEVWEILYGALYKLLKYEDTGLDPDQIREMDKMYLKKCREVNKLEGRLKLWNAGWTPVEMRLPDPDEYVLVSFENFSLPMIGRYTVDDDDSGTFWIGDEEESFVQHDLFVNAWMPLPEPYKPECLGTAANHADHDTIAPAT